MRLIRAISWLVLLTLIIQIGLSAKVSILVTNQKKDPIADAAVRVSLANGYPVDDGYTGIDGVFAAFLDENESYSIFAEKDGIFGNWEGILGVTRTIPIKLKISDRSRP